ncbi:MAG: hypothetical protein J7L39_03920, partial [Candidatus Aenigmarchaeota archaeon]|nr:hypothetical protein [Candidatus Aenigmarchaeota archaeon]
MKRRYGFLLLLVIFLVFLQTSLAFPIWRSQGQGFVSVVENSTNFLYAKVFSIYIDPLNLQYYEKKFCDYFPYNLLNPDGSL